jgi:hypothetical protein
MIGSDSAQDRVRRNAPGPSPIRGQSFRDGPKDQTSDVQLHIGEPLDSGFARFTRALSDKRYALFAGNDVYSATIFCKSFVSASGAVTLGEWLASISQ